MLRTFSLVLLALAACAALSTACSGRTGLDYQNGATSVRFPAAYNPLAPQIAAPLGMSHIAALPGAALNGRSVIAATASDTTDAAVQSVLQVSGSTGSLNIDLAGQVPAATLYVRYDATREHVVATEITPGEHVSFVHDVEPGLLGVGVAASGNASLTAGRLATLHFAPGTAAVVRSVSLITTDLKAKVDPITVVDNGNTSVTLSWAERNPGDLDLNGEVNIADLQRIGKHNHDGYTPADADYAQLEVCDPDGNGEVNVSDLAVLGKNLHSLITGYNIYRTPLNAPTEIPDPADSGRWTKVPNAATPDGPSAPRDYNGQDFRLVYTFIDQSGGGNFGWYVRPTGTPATEEGTTSSVATFTVGGGQPPDAGLSFEIEPPQGPAIAVNDDIYIGVKLVGGVGVFSANIRFEYDGTLLQYVEAVPAYTDGSGTHPNLLSPPLFIGADNVGTATSPYRLLGFNATQTFGTAAVTGDGVLGYVHFKALALGVNSAAIRFPQSTSFIYLWGDQYGVPTNSPALGSPLSISVL